jgi:hypothetical protein
MESNIKINTIKTRHQHSLVHFNSPMHHGLAMDEAAGQEGCPQEEFEVGAEEVKGGSEAGDDDRKKEEGGVD